MRVIVNGSIDTAIKALKRKFTREGVFGELKKRRHYIKPSDQRKIAHAKAVSRSKKAERVRAERDA